MLDDQSGINGRPKAFLGGQCMRKYRGGCSRFWQNVCYWRLSKTFAETRQFIALSLEEELA